MSILRNSRVATAMTKEALGILGKALGALGVAHIGSTVAKDVQRGVKGMQQPWTQARLKGMVKVPKPPAM